MSILASFSPLFLQAGTFQNCTLHYLNRTKQQIQLVTSWWTQWLKRQICLFRMSGERKTDIGPSSIRWMEANLQMNANFVLCLLGMKMSNCLLTHLPLCEITCQCWQMWSSFLSVVIRMHALTTVTSGKTATSLQ